MRGIKFTEIGHVELVEIPDLSLEAPTDALIDITATTVCGSDTHIVAGHMGVDTDFIIGHEYVGVVREVGEAVTNIRPGDRVFGVPAVFCGSCDNCRRGMLPYCRHGAIFGSGEHMGGLSGSQATMMRIPFADNVLLKIPDNVNDAAALATGDVLSTGWAAVSNATAYPGGTFLIIGCGPIGLSAIATAKALASPSRIIAADTVASRLEVAKQMGADEVIVSDANLVKNVLELTNGEGADSVIDAAGAPVTLISAFNAVRVGGHISLIAIPSRPVELPLQDYFYRNPTLWMGLGELRDTATVLQAVADGRLDPAPLFNEEISLEEVPAFYAKVASGNLETIKVLIRP